MNEQTTEFQASASHISLMHRPYGPRVHLSEDTTPAAAGPTVTIEAPADTGDDLSPSQATMAYLAAIAPKKPDPESGAEAAADPEDELAKANAGPEEVPGEEPEGDDPEALPPIERPRSWSKDDDDDWNALPRERQEKIAANERAREADINRRINETADKLKGLTAKEQAAEQAKQTYEAKLPALMQALHNINNTAWADIKSQDDADLLAQVDPARWVQWKAHQDRMAQTNYELQQAENGKAAKHQTEWQDLRNREDALAAEKIPDLADPVKGPKLMERAGKRLADLGFKPEELQNLVVGNDKIAVFDHRFQQLLKDSLDLADIRAAGKTVVPAPRTVPPVQRPGVQRAPGVAATDRVQALDSKLTNSGSLADATALYMAQQSAQRRRAS